MDVHSKKLFTKLSIATLSMESEHVYQVVYTSFRIGTHFSIQAISLSFHHHQKNPSILCTMDMKTRVSKSRFGKQTHYIISRTQKTSCRLSDRSPLITNESTLVMYNGDRIVFTLTKGKRELYFSYYDEISPSLASFLVQAFVFEGFFSSPVYYQTNQQSRKIPASYTRLCNIEEIQNWIDSSYNVYTSLLHHSVLQRINDDIPYHTQASERHPTHDSF